MEHKIACRWFGSFQIELKAKHPTNTQNSKLAGKQHIQSDWYDVCTLRQRGLFQGPSLFGSKLNRSQGFIWTNVDPVPLKLVCVSRLQYIRMCSNGNGALCIAFGNCMPPTISQGCYLNQFSPSSPSFPPYTSTSIELNVLNMKLC